MKAWPFKGINEIFIICLALSFFILACEKQEKSQVQQTQDNPQIFNSKEVCLAGLATVLAWAESPAGGQSEFGAYDSEEGNNHVVKSSKGQYKCYVKGNKIIWGNKDGRWRNTPEDSTVSFSANGKIITVTETFSDGSKNVKDYPKDLLSRYSN